jgi:preprotein translocase subunit SecD
LNVARIADSGRVIYLHPEIIVSTDDIAQSWVTQDGPDRFGVSVEFLEPGARHMRQATASHLGKTVSIMIDGEVVSAPVVRSHPSRVAADLSPAVIVRVSNRSRVWELRHRRPAERRSTGTVEAA